MSVFIKICGMTDSAHIAAAVAAGADAIGFVFHEASPRNISIGQARELAAEVPEGVLTVAVMLHPEVEFAAEVVATLGADVLQTDIDDFDYIKVPDDMSRWPVLRENRLDVGAPVPAVFVYEGAASGAGLTVDWDKAATVAARGRMILAGGLDVDNVAAAVSKVRPWGVDVSSAVEATRGIKDPEKIRQFIAAARNAAT